MRRRLLVRSVSGDSMLPALRNGQIVVAFGLKVTAALSSYRAGDVVIIRHDGKEKIKRIAGIRADGAVRQIFLRGDNSAVSTDSRHFGWVSADMVMGRVVWPKNLHRS